MNLNNITLQPGATHHLFWLNCQAHTPEAVDAFLRTNGIPGLNLGQSIATEFNDKWNSKHFALEVEEYLQHLLESVAKPIATTGIQVIAIYNIGILFEPELALDPDKILKQTSKRTAIVLLWYHHFDQPGIFHWNDRKNDFKLDLTETNIQEILLT